MKYAKHSLEELVLEAEEEGHTVRDPTLDHLFMVLTACW